MSENIGEFNNAFKSKISLFKSSLTNSLRDVAQYIEEHYKYYNHIIFRNISV